jgi:hypothetical protein
MPYKFEGSKYRQTANLTRTEIAKLMRADIKALNLSKGFKISVRCESYSGGGSIDIRVLAVPAEFLLIESLSDGLCQRRTLTPAAKSLLASLKAIHSAYKYDDSDIMTDYSHCRYYGAAEYHYELLDNEQAARPSLLAQAEW